MINLIAPIVFGNILISLGCRISVYLVIEYTSQPSAPFMAEQCFSKGATVVAAP